MKKKLTQINSFSFSDFRHLLLGVVLLLAVIGPVGFVKNKNYSFKNSYSTIDTTSGAKPQMQFIPGTTY